MTRINGSPTPVRLRTTEDSAPAQGSKAVATATPAKLTGFSGLSQFKGPVVSNPSLDGPYGRAPSGARKLSPNDLGVIPQDQGNTNACGTTSLANVLSHWGKPTTHEQIDKDIRAFDMFTAPDKIVDYARSHGMRAEMKVDASVEDLAKMVDQGVPPIVLMDPDSDNNFNAHYITVSGYNRDANGKITDLVIADSAGGDRYTMPVEEFQKKWDDLKMKGVSTGLNNVMISVVPNDGRKITGGDGVTRSASEIKLPKSSFWSNIKSSVARGVANLLANVTNGASKVWNGIKAVGSAIGNAASAVGNAIGNAASAVASGAKKLWNSIFG
jgi:predicted double-glycine peptidase